MILWSIRNASVIDSLEDGNPVDEKPAWAHDPDLEWRRWISFIYDWMVKQMIKKDIPIQAGKYPVWAWYRYGGASQSRPVLTDEYLSEKGTQAVCIEIDVPDSQVLLSDFEMWHWVMNDLFIPFGMEDWEVHSSRPCSREKRMESWKRIFDLEWGEIPFWKPLDERPIQAVIPEICPEWVCSIDRFVAE